MEVFEYYDDLITTSEIIKKIKEVACCEEIRDEHISQILVDIFVDLNISQEETMTIKEKFKILRKKILSDSNLSLEDKYELISRFY